MPLNPPPRCRLIHAPTPLVRAERTSTQLGADVWIKRDDLTGVAESGNKLRKLEFQAAEAQREQADTLITCGGVNSNHARTTAVVAARLGLSSHLVLRGRDRVPPAGNLLLDKLVGAAIDFITPQQWDERDALMQALAERLRAEGRRPYIIPEGGSNALGSLGYAVAVTEILDQVDAAGLDVRRIVHANGSGGTTAGLALGLAAHRRPDIEVVGVAVCNDRAYFDARIERIVDEAAARGWVDASTRREARWTILEGYKGEGYARTTAAEMASHAALARDDGVFVDPVYAGKAFFAIREEIRQGRWQQGTTLFLHTGGIFELFAFSREIQALYA